MKYLLTMMTLLLLVSAVPAVSAADDWDAYLAYSDQFYYLDKQEFRSITCNIESSTVSGLLEQLRQQMAPFGDNIKMVADMSNFSLLYSAVTGFQVNRPKFDIRITSEEGMSDPERVKSGVNMIKSGFEQMIDGLSAELEGILEGFISPQRKNYENVSVTESDGRTIATYQQEGSNVKEAFSGNVLELTQSADGAEMNIQANFEKSAGDKLLLKDATIKISAAAMKAETEITLTHQKVGSLMFPKKISTVSKQEMQAARQEAQTEITLTGCTVD